MAVQFMRLIGNPCIENQGYNYYRVPYLTKDRIVGSWRLLYSNEESKFKGIRVGKITAVHQQIQE